MPHRIFLPGALLRVPFSLSPGVYRIVRHPMYAGLLGVLLGVPLWLRSRLGLIAALVPMGLLIGRILVEERVLRRALPSYADYVARVRFRLVPGVW